MKLQRYICLSLMLSLTAVPLFGQTKGFLHQGGLTSVSQAGEGTFFTAGEDGFVAKWTGQISEHYQLSTVPIKEISSSKDGTLVAVYETDGGMINRVSVWDWTAKKRKFARRFNGAVTALSFSPSMKYVMVGTRYSNGVVFLSAQDGSIINKIKSTIDPVSYSSLSATEQTLFTYSRQGRGGNQGIITYTDMKSGLIKTYKGKQLRFNTDAALTQATLFHNNVFLAGVSGNTIKIIAADSGIVCAAVKAQDPVILKCEDADDLYYMEGSGETRSLMMIEAEGKENISTPETLISVPFAAERITAGAACTTGALFGTDKGGVYLCDSETIEQLNAKSYTRVLDCASHGDSVYFLTDDSVIRSSYDSRAAEHIASNDGETNMALWDEGIILWSKGKASPVVLLDTAKKDMALDSISGEGSDAPAKVLFTPKDAITSLHVSNGKIIYVEGEKKVKHFDIAAMKSEALYSSVSIQDAVEADGALYVAKSAGVAPPFPLVKVDIITHEAKGADVGGDIAFSLATDGKYIYGASYDSAKEKTVIFSYSTATKLNTALISFASEDRSAFVTLDKGNILTNIGHNATLVYNPALKRNVTLSRTAALPSSASATSSFIAVVGKDGSVSWYKDGKCLDVWYLTEEGWTEY